jgi:hypothetical protein
MAAPDIAIRSNGSGTWLLFAQSEAGCGWAREQLNDGRERRGSAIVIGSEDVHRLVPSIRRAGLRVEIVAPTLERLAVKVGTLRHAVRAA